jgi:O-Antigen ligase
VSACLFLAVGHQITAEWHLRRLVWTFLILGTFACLVQMVPSLGIVGFYTTRPRSMGSLFWTWLVAISASQAIFNRQLRPLVRLALLSVTLMVLGHGLIQVRSWASGWLPPLVVLGALSLLRFPRFTIDLGLVSAPVALGLWSQISSVLLEEETYSLMTREEAWRVLWNLVERSPLLGTGPANYYYYTENFPILGWYVRFISHNNYQDFLVQTGFIGLLAFCWFGFEAGWLALRLYRSAPRGFARAYAAGAFGGVAGSLASGMLGDWIVPFYYNAGILGFRSSLLFWVFVGGLLALKRIAASPSAADVEPGSAPRRTYRDSRLAAALTWR